VRFTWRRPRVAGSQAIAALVVLVVGGTLTVAQPSVVAAESASGVTPSAKTLASHLDAGVDHSCAVFVNGAVKCWGRNSDGQLGYGDTTSRGDSVGETEALPSVELGTSRTAKSVASGWNTTCAILDNDALKCWGRNDHGQLGLGAAGNRGGALLQMGDDLPAVDLGAGRTVTAISLGNYNVTAFACAILDTGQVKCWGDNSKGQLGIGNFTSKGIFPGDMGDALPTVNIGAGRRATSISVGAEHTCVILTDHQTVADSNVKCWGGNDFGQLGLDDTFPRGANAADMTTLPAVNLGLGRKAVAIAAGSSHTCAILDDGTVKCWGDNSWGELGTGDGNDYGAGTSSPGTGAPVLPMASLPAVTFGPGRTATAIALGDVTSCAVLDNGLVTCWGDGGAGQLGNGTSSTSAPLPVTAYSVFVGHAATAITLGDEHVCATTDDGSVRCWGIDDGGRLGRNTNTVAAAANPPTAPINFRAGANALLVAVPAKPPLPTTNRFVPLPPARILDTRNGLGAPRQAVAAGTEIVLQVAGRGGVPPTGAMAVVLNVTADQAAGAGYVTVYPADVTTRPEVSSLNLVRADQTVANLVTVQLSADGAVRLFTTVATELLADVAGYYTPAAAATAGRFVAVNPQRMFDTRSTSGLRKLGANERISVALRAVAPIPPTGVSALVLNVTVANAGGAGFATVWPSDIPLPTVSNLNVDSVGQAIANQVIVPLSADGKVSFYSSDGADIIADVAGYFTDASAPAASTGLFTPVVPGRVFDSRSGTPSKLGPAFAARTAVVAVNGRGNLPAATMSAIVINLTATDTGAPGYVSAWPPTLVQPNVSTLNWSDSGDTVPNHATVRVGPDGKVSFFASTTTHLLADSAGWYS
jgi:alpha-tubulin suppressor-like RCC1 family protein